MCDAKLLLVLQLYWHWVHLKGLSSGWNCFMCNVNSPLVLLLYWHWVHFIIGISSECTRFICCVSSPLVLHLNWHWGQLKILSSKRACFTCLFTTDCFSSGFVECSLYTCILLSKGFDVNIYWEFPELQTVGLLRQWPPPPNGLYPITFIGIGGP